MNAAVELQDETMRRLLVKEGGRIFFVNTEDIEWIESVGNYARVHTKARTHLIRITIKELERRLDAAQFTRIHRSTIVNMTKVREIQPFVQGDYVVVLADGTKLRVGRHFRQGLLKDAS